ncbi:MAG: radical SAM protein [Gammaproteobacteria bacterium]|nr:radical SAM protein [Gammaproteobacteria bacterium]
MKTIQYIEPLFRPPSEANSLIFQITNGCSWNKCAFCEMYTAPQKKFSTKKEELVFEEIEIAATTHPETRRIFLADGDAMALSTRRLLAIMQHIQKHFSSINRISAYCLPRNVKNKSVNELKELKDAGLGLVYVGAESGDDELLRLINKGETLASTVDSLHKLHSADIKASVMVLNGLGGNLFTEQHAQNSARLVNESQPHYLSTLVLSFPLGETRFLSHFPANFKLLDQNELFHEMDVFLQHTELNNTIFRSDHASNYLSLKGVLGKDKEKLLAKLHLAQTSPEKAHLRKEWQRGL